MRAQNEPASSSCARRAVGRRPTSRRLPRRAVDPALAAGRSGQSRGSRRARRRLAGRRADPRRLRRAGREGAMLRGEVTAVEVQPGRARELAENVAGSARQRPRRQRRRPRARRGRLRPCARRCALLRARRARAPARPALALAACCRSSSSSCSSAAAERTRPGGTIVYSVCTLNADENEAVVDASASSPSRSATSGRSSPTRSDPSSC